MGCDIHMRAEVRRDGRWHAVGEVFDSDWRDGKSAEPYDNRNYRLFAMLADVRNGYGFAGVPTGSGFRPIDDPRGAPQDMGPEVGEWMRDALEWGHSHSWLALRELREYDWDGQASTIYGVVPADVYERHSEVGEPPDSWCGGISGPGIVTFTPEGYEEWKANGRPDIEPDPVSRLMRRSSSAGVLDVPYQASDEGTKPYVRMAWPWTYREAAGGDWFEAMDKLAALVPEGGTDDDVRIVFWFDS